MTEACGRLSKGRCRLTSSSSARCNLYTKRESEIQFARSYQAACQTGMACRTIHLSNGSIMMRRPMVILEIALLAGSLLTATAEACSFEQFLRSGSNGCQKADRSSRLRPEPALRRARTAPENGCFPVQLIHRSLRKSTAISHSVAMP